VPVWHQKAQKFVDTGRLVIIGLVEEQHPDRCQLFLQWKKIGWPMLHDPINKTGQAGVPIVTAIDEHGIVRLTRPDPDNLEQDFLNKTFPKPASLPTPGPAAAPDRKALRAKAEQTNRAEDWREYADAEVLWGGAAGVEAAIRAYRKAIRLDTDDAVSRFRLGVCYRMRYDSPQRREGDLQRALTAWQDALDLNPNQYIWRRRIQQYGPRLEKPYPFYDWVAQARAEVRARGETPMALTAEPTGAELAPPSRRFDASRETAPPDADGRITRDAGRYIRIESAVAPARVKPGAAARIHLVFRPNARHRAHWNNEAEPLRIRIHVPNGWAVDQRRIERPNPETLTSTEAREINFEIRVPENATPGKATLSAYALYNVCEDANGQCLFRRQDITIPVVISSK
jgi:hypothetical protein